MASLRVSAVFSAEAGESGRLPLFSSSVSAGFPSPADDHIDKRLDLNDFLVRNPAATFFVKVDGESMRGAGIYPGDILVVDRSLKPANNKVIIARLNGELTVKRMRLAGSVLLLVPENDDYKPIRIEEGMDFEVWGVVTSVIHAV